MSATTGSCSCGCGSCACDAPSGPGCAGSSCVPRPCFFNGQLVTSDDLNAMVAYFRARESMLARHLGGWGVLSGLRVDKAPGIQSAALAQGIADFTPNPQIIAGTTLQVSPGVAIDASGRALAVCSPVLLDVAELITEAPSAPVSKSPSAWLEPFYNADMYNSMAATEYWLIAEYEETPTRPVPKYAGGGPCDPAPTCDYSRKIEGVRFRLVPTLPITYGLTGCLDNIVFPPASGVTGAPFGGTTITLGWGTITVGTLTTQQCVYASNIVADAFAQLAANVCCSQPAVVLARLLVTSSPGSLLGTLPSGLTRYVMLFDDYPNRRIVPSTAGLLAYDLLTHCTPQVAP